jgi:hypothetical protein
MAMCRSYDVLPASVVDIQHREALVVTYCSLQSEGFFENDFEFLENRKINAQHHTTATPRFKRYENRLSASDNFDHFLGKSRLCASTMEEEQEASTLRCTHTPPRKKLA